MPVNLPVALIGGIFAMVMGQEALSVAALVGFITLFGIATCDGVLLVTHYQYLMREERLPLPEAVRRGAHERLAPVLMTALTAGLALVPLVLAGHKPDNEIQSPMGIVVLGGLLTSTFLNMVLVPVLFARWGGEREAAAWKGFHPVRPPDYRSAGRISVRVGAANPGDGDVCAWWGRACVRDRVRSTTEVSDGRARGGHRRAGASAGA